LTTLTGSLSLTAQAPRSLLLFWRFGVLAVQILGAALSREPAL
jgi:hypothetical protein